MALPPESHALREIRRLFSGWLGVPEKRLEPRSVPEAAARADLVLQAGGPVFVVEYKGFGDAASVARAAEQATQYAQAMGRRAVPVVAVGFMGELGRGICERAGVSWLDLSGNAHVVASGLRILIEGKPNKFKSPGRPSSVYAPKSSRVVRQILFDPGTTYTQRELSRLTRIGEGFVSRIVGRLEADGHLKRDESGALHVVDPNLLLDAWLEVYDFSKHSLRQGHVAARSAEELVTRLANDFATRRLAYALTGLGAAWALTKHAAFRLVTFYVDEPLDADLLGQIGFRDEPRGANVWLVVPNDEGVLDRAEVQDAVRIVHPLQVYLDLKAQPERAKEAAEEVRKEKLNWKVRGFPKGAKVLPVVGDDARDGQRER